MYPLKAILIGSDESLLPIIRRELLNQNVEIEQEFSDVASTMTPSTVRSIVVSHYGFATRDRKLLRTSTR